MTKTLINDLYLVQTDSNHKTLFTTTRSIASFLKVEHKYVLRKLKMMMKKSKVVGAGAAPSSYTTIQNKQAIEYRLTKLAALRFVQEFETEEAHQIKDAIVIEFQNMELELIEWREGRRETKSLTKHTNESINQFIKYAEIARGSQYEGVARYFNMFQKQINRIVVGRDSFNRDLLPVEHLAQIVALEDILSEALITQMEKGLEYHDIAKTTLQALRDIGKLNMDHAGLKQFKALSPKQGTLFVT